MIDLSDYPDWRLYSDQRAGFYSDIRIRLLGVRETGFGKLRLVQVVGNLMAGIAAPVMITILYGNHVPVCHIEPDKGGYPGGI